MIKAPFLIKTSSKNIKTWVFSWLIVCLIYLSWGIIEKEWSLKLFFFPLTTFNAILVLALFNFSIKALKAFFLFTFTCLSVLGVKSILGIDIYLKEFFSATSFSSAIFSCTALSIYLCSFIKDKFLCRSIKLFIIFLLSFAVLMPAAIWAYYFALGELLTSDIILALAQTNNDESIEYVLSHISFGWFLASLFVLSFIFLNAIFFIGLKPQKNHISALFLIALSLFVFSNSCVVIPKIDYFATTVLKVTGRQLEQFKVFSENVAKREERLKKLKATINDDTSDGIFVLVLGESHCRDHFQVYGYKRETTPYLNYASDHHNTFVFNNAYSCFPQTVPALINVLTEKNQYKDKELSEAFSVLDVAKVAGFETYWLSNQRKYGIYETPISVISSTADFEEWTNGTSGMQSVFYDKELIKRLPDLNGKNKVLIVFHLMGSHQKYSQRTPNEFKLFLGDDEIVDDYDASILYIDSFLEDLYKEISNYSQFKGLIFISDHGEELSNGIYDHNPTKFTFPMVRIPMVVQLSESYIKQEPKRVETLKRNINKVWTNDLTFDLLLGIMGINGKFYNSKLDISSKDYMINKDNALTLLGEKKISEDLKSD